jgi:hypothetical protein
MSKEIEKLKEGSEMTELEKQIAEDCKKVFLNYIGKKIDQKIKECEKQERGEVGE